MGSLTGTPLPSPEGPSSDRLESWKEIAAYLKRGVRTVQRWERQEGLPVHRHVHEERSSVFAYMSELDAWRASVQLRFEEKNPEITGASRRWRVVFAGVWVLASILIVSLGVTFWRSQGGRTSFWSGDGKFKDSLGANTLRNAGGVTFAAGKIGQAFHFDGAANSYLTLPNSTTFAPASNQVTIAAWVRPDFAASNGSDTIFSKRDGCALRRSFALLITKAGSVGMYPIGSIIWSASTAWDDALAKGVFPNDGQFHFVAGTYDGKAMTVYLDAIAVASKARTGPIPKTSDVPYIGMQSGCEDLTVADLDEILFYDRALSGDEIKSLMKAPRPLIVANKLK